MLYIEQHLKDQLSTELNRDERLVWAGTPTRGIQFSSEDRFMIPFSLVWCLFIAFWISTAFESSILFALIGIPFALIGLFLLFGRFLFDSKVRANTVYGLTNERVLIKTRLNGSLTNSFPLSKANNIEFTEHKDGTGTIEFMSLKAFMSRPGTKNITSISPSSSRLFKIENPQEVYLKIIEAREKLD